MTSTTTLIIGAGQCGLAMSHALTRHSIDHLVLDSGEAGESWRKRRWKSLRLLTPNSMNQLPGEEYVGSDPGGYMTASRFAADIRDWVDRNKPPVMTQTSVTTLVRVAGGYRAETSRGPIQCRSAVIATGACATSKRPGFAADLPGHIRQLSPIDYCRPSELSSGGVLVVGASASGLQIAREIALSGRKVTLAVGNHGRLPRRYRGKDIVNWMDLIGVFDEPFTDVDDIERVRRTPSLPLVGLPTQETLDLNTLQALGVEITGRLMTVSEGAALFSGSLANACASADLKMNRLLDRIDQWISTEGLESVTPAACRFTPTDVPEDPRLKLDLSQIDTVIWATGFNPDHSFVQFDVFDRKRRIKHFGGVVEPGLYVMGLPYMRTARSVHIDGAERDAAVLCQHLLGSLADRSAA